MLKSLCRKLFNKKQILNLVFYAVIFCIPFQTSKHFIFSFSYINNTLVDYLIPTIYISDILILVLVLLDITFYGYNTFFIYQFRTAYRKVKNVIKNVCSIRGLLDLEHTPGGIAIILLIGFLYWNCISVSFSANPLPGIYKVIKILEFTLFTLWIAARIKNSDTNKIIIAILLSLAIESYVALAEWYNQKSIGLQFLGEWVRNQYNLELSKVFLNGTYYLRPYATFPHPNVLAGFIGFSILISLHVFTTNSTGRLFATLNRSATVLLRALHSLLLLLAVWTLFLTFSRSAWMAFVAALFLLFLLYIFLVLKSSSAGKRLLVAGVLAASVGFGSYLIYPYTSERFQSLETYEASSLVERIEYMHMTYVLVKKAPLFGVGPNNYIFHQVALADSNPVPSRYYQPAHTVILLIASESGIVGATMVIIGTMSLCYGVVKRFQTELKNNEKSAYQGMILIGLWAYIISISFFDHYLYTIQSGLLMTFLLIALSLAYTFHNNET